jgi:hypothetical protein
MVSTEVKKVVPIEKSTKDQAPRGKKIQISNSKFQMPNAKIQMPKSKPESYWNQAKAECVLETQTNLIREESNDPAFRVPGI